MYGLTEIYRDQIRTARLVANPGCYPTSVQIPLHPLLKVRCAPAALHGSSAAALSSAACHELGTKGFDPRAWWWSMSACRVKTGEQCSASSVPEMA